jgi:addiction module HigA family antidote
MRKKKAHPSIHPGEILMKDFPEPMGVTQYRLAKSMNVPQRRIGEIVHGKRAITADTALRLGHAFGIEPQFWLNLQAHYDLEVATERMGGRIAREVTKIAA